MLFHQRAEALKVIVRPAQALIDIAHGKGSEQNSCVNRPWALGAMV